MESLVCEIAKDRLITDFDKAFEELGLFVTGLWFDDSEGFSVIVELSADEGVIVFNAS
ncbi:MAG: hypothetical protein GX957_02540 [Clostridiaceae bacterium]|nr:hypothetical protein [Clostridiaceae bacterium]